jgi:aspartyl-tRNA(Asn)/glutamyl-tRNA(Gln) amidotransferase subunit B
MAGWETVIGLECHVELDTQTKMFCGCRNEFGAEPNTLTCPVCLGHPGSLPVPNREAIARIVRIGLALGSEIAPRSLFHRKNYFYPDMPKNYQISQYDLPVCVGGHLDVELADGSARTVGITRVHMEEDTGKTVHGSASGRIHEAEHALVDYNRAGVPLVECVSEPDMRSPEEAATYLRELRALLASLDVSDVRMEEGSLRCDANISIRTEGSDTLGVKVEIKNMNSVRSLERALSFEADRQIAALEAGDPLVQETRHWDEDSGTTKSMRSKEEAFDYRYFPEPDIPALAPDDAWIEEIRAALPPPPREQRRRAKEELTGPSYDLRPELADQLVRDAVLVDLFKDLSGELAGVGTNTVANWILNDPASPTEMRAQADDVARVIGWVSEDRLSRLKGHEALQLAREEGASVESVIDDHGWWQESDAGELGAVVDSVIAENEDAAAKFRAGNDGVLGFLVGQVMKASGGSANPKIAQELLRERLSG